MTSLLELILCDMHHIAACAFGGDDASHDLRTPTVWGSSSPSEPHHPPVGANEHGHDDFPVLLPSFQGLLEAMCQDWMMIDGHLTRLTRVSLCVLDPSPSRQTQLAATFLLSWCAESNRGEPTPQPETSQCAPLLRCSQNEVLCLVQDFTCVGTDVRTLWCVSHNSSPQRGHSGDSTSPALQRRSCVQHTAVATASSMPCATATPFFAKNLPCVDERREIRSRSPKPTPNSCALPSATAACWMTCGMQARSPSRRCRLALHGSSRCSLLCLPTT